MKRRRAFEGIAVAIALSGCLDRVTLVRHSADGGADVEMATDSAIDSAIVGDTATSVDSANDAASESAAIDSARAEAPRLLSPMSTSFLTGTRPRLRWQRHATAEQVVVQMCADRACSRVEDTRTVDADSIDWPVSLSAGTHYWRAFGRSAGRNSEAPSATWQLHVPRRESAANSAWGSFTDFNGDGFGDVAIGSPEARARAGVVQVHLGSTDSIPAAESVTLLGSAGRFGFSTASVGDINGDGFADLAVGAPDDNSETGIVFVMFGAPTGIDPMAARSTVVGRSPGDHFGASVAAAGDIDGDGYGDVVIGAPDANSGQGRAWVYFGSAGGLVGSGVELTGEREPAARVGHSVTGACDVNRDGFADIIVGSPTGRAGSGVAHLYLGAGSRALTTRVAIEPVAASDWFGFAVTRAGDVDGDGHCDVLIGAPNSNAGRGAAHVYSSRVDWRSASASVSMSGPATSTGFGYALAEARDVNGDGLDDVAIGAPGDAASSFVYVLRGSSSSTIETTPWSSATLPAQLDRFGRAIGGRADFNGDGLFDLVVAQPEWGALSGRVAIVHGGSSAMTIVRRVVSTYGGYFGGAVARGSTHEAPRETRSVARPLRRG